MSVMLRAHFVKAGRPEKHWQAGAAVGSERRVLSNSGQFLLDLFSRLGTGEANMSIFETVGPLLVARAATDPDAAKLLEIFTKAEKMLSESSLARIGVVEMSKAFTASNGRSQMAHNGY